MREIKFRAKLIKRYGDKPKGQWVYGLPQQRVEIGGIPNLDKPAEIGYIVTYEPERGLQSGAPVDDLYWYEIDPKTLGQFTGLKDKTAKEIYEWDIIKGDHYYADVPEIVKYERGAWNYSYELREYVEDPGRDWTVIGNIYENIGLLEQKEEQQ